MDKFLDIKLYLYDINNLNKFITIYRFNVLIENLQTKENSGLDGFNVELY